MTEIAYGPIPAGAGETLCGADDPRVVWAYPRGRGGNARSINFMASAKGLSPRARGKHQDCPDHRSLCGPIPAGAGETNWTG